MKSSQRRQTMALGAITAIGPFAIDMYLPAFDSIARDLHATPGAVQGSLVSFFVALAVGQMLFGPVSDMIGRRKPLFFGLFLFMAASVACALAPNVEMLVVFRFFQGLGGCAGMVMSRAIIRDMHEGEAAARLFAATLLVLGLSPVFAPVLGSLIAVHLSWRFIFVATMAIAMVATLLVALFLPETRPPEKRQKSGVGHAMRLYSILLRDGWFLSAVLTAGFSQATLFAYIAGSAFVFISTFHVSPFVFSALFAINAVALIGGAQFTARLMRRFGLEKMIGTAVTALAAIAVILPILAFAGTVSLPATIVLVFGTIGTLGFIMSPSTILALRPHGALAGTASALMGTIQFALGAFSGFLISAFFDGTARPLFITMAGAAVAARLSWQVFLWIGHHRRGIEAVPSRPVGQRI